MPGHVVLGNALVDGVGVVDVTVDGAIVTAVGRAGPSAATAARLDLDGYVLLPSFVEPHAHLDKALTAGRVPNPAGDLAGAVTAWLAARPRFSSRDIAERALSAALDHLGNGVTLLRTHVDVGTDIGVRAVEALVEVRAGLADRLDVEIVAGCNLPITGAAAADNLALTREALALGADLVGGAPWLDADPPRALDALAELATEGQVGLDLHTDETLDPSVLTVTDLVRLRRDGFTEPITASHAVSLGTLPPERQRELAAQLAEAQIAVVTLPQTNLYLQGRTAPTATPRGLTAIRALLDAGVVVAAGADNVRDPFNPIGRPDPLHVASLLVGAGHVFPREALLAVTESARSVVDPRRATSPPSLRVKPGDHADLVAVRAPSLEAVVATASPERVVLRAGRVVARTELQRTFAHDPAAPLVGATAT